uniref:B30.2/SPRY domain-containing protein n=1 Tax=Astyanax mexicanus TaxID=7994 RepID=A0A3B1IPF3_ASTMX
MWQRPFSSGFLPPPPHGCAEHRHPANPSKGRQQHTDTQTHSLTSSECANCFPNGLWTVRGNRNTRRKPTQTLRERENSTQKDPGHPSRESNPSRFQSGNSATHLDVTLDPDTSNPYLILSDDGKQVRCGGTKQNLPDNSERFNNCICVLGKEGFSSGRFYYEVQVSGKTDWDLGVVRESINRKGEITLSPQNGFWTVVLRNGNEYEALAGPSVSLSLRENLQKVGVFVDYEEGLVSFYDVVARSHIYSFTGQTFTKKLYPYFNPCFNNEGKNSAPLIISPVTHDD